MISQQPTDTVSRSFQVPLESDYVVGGDTISARNDDGTGETSRPAAADFELQNMDAVYVRRSPGFEPQKTVYVTGEVLYPGPYSVRTKDDQIVDLIERAGGLTDQAYRQGLQLWRRSKQRAETQADTAAVRRRLRAAAGLRDTVQEQEAEQGRREMEADTTGFTGTGRLARDTAGRRERTRVGIEFVKAFNNPDHPANVELQAGDSIHVPEYEPTVTVRGAVGVETQVLHQDGAGLGYYIDQAGGYSQFAAEGRTRVRYADGQIRTRGGGFLFFGGGVPEPDPGSVVFVPEVPPERRGGADVQTIVGIMSTAASALATVLIAAQ